ncbi:hypothetical protein D3C71_2098610 [compost metagenome]
MKRMLYGNSQLCFNHFTNALITDSFLKNNGFLILGIIEEKRIRNGENQVWRLQAQFISKHSGFNQSF